MPKTKKNISVTLAQMEKMEVITLCKEALRLAFKHEVAYWDDAEGTDNEKLGKIVSLMQAAVWKIQGGPNA